MFNEAKDILSSLSEGLIGRLRRDCASEWKNFTQHRFIKELAQGILPKENFKNFLIQDYFYLIEYARAEALAIYKSGNLTDMHYSIALLEGLLNVELPLHESYCQEWGISIKDLQAAPKSLELIAYSQFILGKGMQGDLLDLMVTMAPCLVGYGEIGLSLLISSETNWENNPYAPWIKLYGSQEYIQILKDGIGYLEDLAKRYGDEARYPQLQTEFQTAVKLETLFWDAGGNLVI